MAAIDSISITLTLAEARAVHKALGRMSGKDYGNDEESAVGSDVYSELTRFVDDEDG